MDAYKQTVRKILFGKKNEVKSIIRPLGFENRSHNHLIGLGTD